MDMTAPRHTARIVSLRSCRVLCCALLLVSTAFGAPVAQAAEGTALDAVQLAALADQQRIDRETRAFDSPLLIRLRAGIAPTWPGPRGAPPFTERRTCPALTPRANFALVPPFC
jgi:hypothetical protein